MKKFFSLVLALVMAMSLTAVAWGETKNATPADINAVIASASAGDTIQLAAGDYNVLSIPLSLTNLTIKGGTGVNLATLSLSKTNKGVEGGPLYGAPDGLTLDGLTIANVSSVEGGTVIKNLTIKNCAFTDGINFSATSSVDGLTIENCTFSNIADKAIVFNCKASASHYAKNIVIKNNDFSNIGYNAINFSNSSASGSIVITGNTIDETGDRAVRISAGADAELTISGNEVTSGVDGAGEVIKVSGSTCATTIENNTFHDDNAQVVVGDITNAIDVTTDSNGKITAGTFSVLPDESYLADGVSFVGNTVTVTNKNANSYEGLYAQDTDTLAKVADVDIVVTPAKAPKYDKTTGLLDTEGNIEYVNITGDGTYYMFVSSLADADVVLYKDAAYKQVKFYLAEIETPYYYEGVAFNNFGEKCGQVDYDDYDKTLKYFTIKGADEFVLVEEAEEYACDGYVLYNGKMIPVVGLGLDKVAHTAVYTTKNGVVETIECGACGLKAVKVPNALSLPKGADVVTGETVWYWPAGTTSDKLVESAQTFDAGIAMYVGMSVMAAAGSAVVIGKKKD